MRVQTSRVIAQQMRSLGAVPVPLSFSETRLALSKGIVNGTENPLSNFWTQGMHEVQSHLTLTAHGYLGYAVITHQRFWNSLPANLQVLIQQAMNESLEFGNLIAEEQNEKALKAITASGKTKVHQLTLEQRARLKKAVQPVYDQWTRQYGHRLLNAIRSNNPGYFANQ
jgi:C4-dicarboxylate-binding protein DctP